jgi:hypothetical protein
MKTFGGIIAEHRLRLAERAAPDRARWARRKAGSPLVGPADLAATGITLDGTPNNRSHFCLYYSYV